MTEAPVRVPRRAVHGVLLLDKPVGLTSQQALSRAKRLLLLTDVAGVLDKDKNLISELKVGDLPNLIANGTITGGMIPKVESAAAVVESGVEGVIILDGRVPHSVLLELLTPHGVGTRISRAGA